MGLTERIELYRQIEEHRQRPLMVYATSFRQGAEGGMSSDVIPEFIDQIQALPIDTEKIDLLIESSGGDPLAAWRIMSLLREKVAYISVMVPYCALSAATLLALGGNELILGDYGCLGPIDPQIVAKKSDGSTQRFAYLDIVSFIKFVKEEAGLTEQSYAANAANKLFDQVDPSTIGMSRRAASLSVTMAEKLLRTHMLEGESRQEATIIAKKLNESFFSHGHAVGRSEAKEIGLNIVNADDILKKLTWAVHVDIEKDLKFRKPFNPIATFLADPGAEPFLQSPPPIMFPPQIQPQQAQQIISNYINQQFQQAYTKNVGVTLVHALIESPRHASSFVQNIKILLNRTPELKYIASLVKLESGWGKCQLPDSNNGEGSEGTDG